MKEFFLFVFIITFIQSCSISIVKFRRKDEFVNIDKEIKFNRQSLTLTEPLILTEIDGPTSWRWATKPFNFSPYGRGHLTFPIGYDSIVNKIKFSTSKIYKFQNLNCFRTYLKPNNFLKKEGSLSNTEFIKCLNLPQSDSLFLIMSFLFEYGYGGEPHMSGSKLNGQICLVKNGSVLYYRHAQHLYITNSGGNKDFPVKQIVKVMKMLTDDLIKSLE